MDQGLFDEEYSASDHLLFGSDTTTFSGMAKDFQVIVDFARESKFSDLVSVLKASLRVFVVEQRSLVVPSRLVSGGNCCCVGLKSSVGKFSSPSRSIFWIPCSLCFFD